MLPAPTTISRTRRIVVRAAPTSTTNMTGFFSSVTGFSLTNDCRVARPTICGVEQRAGAAEFLRHQGCRIFRRSLFLNFRI